MPVNSDSLQQRIAAALSYDYRLERPLGAGSMATVFLAHDLKHDRQVALKVLRPDLALAVGADRFLREIRMAAKLNHPNIVPLLDSGEVDGLLYYTMPVVEGQSLRERLRRERRLPVEDALRITADVARALAYAHERGVVHRDVKPENILLEEGTARLVDFGIALAIEEAENERLTHAGVAIGTPAYMSPEQGAGSGAVDHRSDIYSLACVVFEMLAGEAPFDAPTVQATIVRQMVDPPPRLRKSRPVVPLAIEATVERALAKDPADRFQSVSEFAEALVDPSWQARLPRPARRLSRRGRLTTMTVAAALVVIAGAATLAPRLGAGAPAPLRERDWVLVADFDGPPSDATLAAAVRELVTTELNQSRFLSTMPRQALASTIRAAGLEDTATVNVELARELAYRSAVRAVIGGRIDSTPSGYALTLRALDSGDGHELARDSATTSADSLVDVVQRLARVVRQRLGERREDIEANQPLLEIATPSLPAFRRYVEAAQRKVAGDVAGSSRLVHEAIGLDSGFASAWMFLGMNYIEARDLDSARFAFDQAQKEPTHLTRSQQYRLLAEMAYTIDHDLPATVRWYREYLKEVPRSVGGRNNLGLYLSMLGRYEEALAQFDTSAMNNPFGAAQSQPALINATDMLMALGKLGLAESKARELTGAYASFAQLRLLTANGHWAAAESLAVKLLASPTTAPALRVEAQTTRAAALALRGSVRAADSVLAAAARTSAGPQRRWYEQARTLLTIASGVRPRGRSALDLPDDSYGALVARGMRAAVLGDTAAAREARRRLAALPETERRRLRHGALAIDALLDGAAGRWQRVVDALRDSALAGVHDATDLDHVPSLTLRWLVADAFAHLGQTDSAITWMHLAVTSERIPPGHRALRGFAYPFAMRRLAQWRAKIGDQKEAERDWATFTETFTAPDRSLRGLLAPPMFVQGTR